MNSSPIKIFIVDDHPLMRQALRASIQTEADMDVVGTAADGIEAVELIPPLLPDLVIMDLMMPNMDGFDAMKNLHKDCPKVPILILSSLEKEEHIFEAVQAGARGYITKDVQHDELVNAIQIVSAGKSYLPDKIVEKLMDGVRQSLIEEKPDNLMTYLTKREKEVLLLLGKNYTNTMIAQELVLAASTVRVHIHQIMKKMAFENRHDAVLFVKQQKFRE